MIKDSKYIRMAMLGVAFFCIFKLGELNKETQFFKKLDTCVKSPDNANLQEFYGHSFKGLEHTLWNHAKGHNASIYLDCIFKDLNR